MACDLAAVLADAPAPVGAGAALATAPGLVGAPANLVFALRGAGSSDFWQYNIAQNAWTVMPSTPEPVGDGAALVEVASCGGNSLFEIAALRGGGTSDFWCFDIAHSVWVTGPGIPPVPAATGPGVSLAQLQRFGYIYALRGGGTSDFWQLKSGTWKQLSDTPDPVNAGGALVGINYGTQSHSAVLMRWKEGVLVRFGSTTSPRTHGRT